MQFPGLKSLARRHALKMAAIPFVRSALEDKADLSPFMRKPTPAIVGGVFAIALSFLLGWPTVALLGAVAIRMKNPWIAAVGGPVAYGLSHLVFLAGMYLSGATYSVIFLRWLTRVSVERLLQWCEQD